MEKKNLDWANIGFAYRKTDKRYVSDYKDGSWDEGRLIGEENILLNESAGILQYCQECFEGLKAYTTKSGDIVAFRPELNALRMQESALRMEMPVFPAKRFLEAIDSVVRANEAWIPPYGSGASFYIRPYMFASSPVIGVKPAEEYQFRVFGTPVGPYFKGGIRPLSLCVSDFDRAAPRGSGHVKAGLNYAMSLHALMQAKAAGFDENVFLDPATRSLIEEAGGANFIFIGKEGELITPKSASILPSITRRSLLYVAEHYLGMRVYEREVRLEELKEFAEAALCGTAAVLSPIGRIVDRGREILFPSGMESMGKWTKKLYDTLIGIQLGSIEAPEGWLRKVI
ncbi:MAG: branched-chain amino acid aminotransferase [Johnsonella sp.]|nr:branched-chain amino acid aminotransferase [Johnsonella sp.]